MNVQHAFSDEDPLGKSYEGGGVRRLYPLAFHRQINWQANGRRPRVTETQPLGSERQRAFAIEAKCPCGYHEGGVARGCQRNGARDACRRQLSLHSDRDVAVDELARVNPILHAIFDPIPIVAEETYSFARGRKGQSHARCTTPSIAHDLKVNPAVCGFPFGPTESSIGVKASRA
jgi:hypothetical protein